MGKKFEIESKDLERKCIDEVIARIDELDGETPGIIAAQDIIDIVTETLGPAIYNQGVRDAKKKLQERIADLEVDIDLLEQS